MSQVNLLMSHKEGTISHSLPQERSTGKITKERRIGWDKEKKNKLRIEIIQNLKILSTAKLSLLLFFYQTKKNNKHKKGGRRGGRRKLYVNSVFVLFFVCFFPFLLYSTNLPF